MTTNEVQELWAVASFDPRTLFEADGVTLRDAAVLRTLPGVEGVRERDGRISVKLKDKTDALFKLVEYLAGQPDRVK